MKFVIVFWKACITVRFNPQNKGTIYVFYLFITIDRLYYLMEANDYYFIIKVSDDYFIGFKILFTSAIIFAIPYRIIAITIW